MDKQKLTLYNPAELEKEDLIAGFVARQKPFNDIMAEIRGQKPNDPIQHYLVIGQRGMGKTTLLYRVRYEVENDPKLNDSLIPVSFSEEQHNIVDLGDVWLSVARSLEQSHSELFSEVLDEIEMHDSDPDFATIAFDLLKASIKQHDKQLLLLVDNMGILLDSIQENQAQRLREILMTEKRIRLIGASSFVLEHSFEYQKPFFEFFKQIRLKGLSSEETLDVLRNLAKIQGSEDKIEHIIETQPHRIETIRRLTGGVIRTIVLLFEILADHENGKVLNDLEAVLDRVTPLYQHRMELLKPQQKLIVDVVARSWDAITVGDIAKDGRIARQDLKSNQISAQLKQLVDNQVIEEESIEGRRGKLYRIRERFFNIWYLMRSTRKHDKQRVIWLIRFFEAWCTAEQLTDMAKCQIDGYKKGIYSHNAALTRAMAIASVPSLGSRSKYTILEETLQYLYEKNSNSAVAMKKQFSKDFETIDELNSIYEYFETKDIEEIKKIADTKLAEKEIDATLKLIAILIKEYSNYELALDYLMKFREIDIATGSYAIGLLLYYNIPNYKEAEKYLLEAFKNGISKASMELGDLYSKHIYNYEAAEKYYKVAIENNIPISKLKASLLYINKGAQFEKALPLLLDEYNSSDNDRKGTLSFAIAFCYYCLNKMDKASEYCVIASKLGDRQATGLLFTIKVGKLNEPVSRYISKAQSFLYPRTDYLKEGDDWLAFKIIKILLAEGQYHFVKKFFEDHELEGYKDIYKPAYYATLKYLNNETSLQEFQKAGSELQETIEEFINSVEETRKEIAEIREKNKKQKT